MMLLAPCAHWGMPGQHAALVVNQEGWHTTLKLLQLYSLLLVWLRAALLKLNPSAEIWYWLRERDRTNIWSNVSTTSSTVAVRH